MTAIALTDSEWNNVLASLPASPEAADGWELSLVRRTLERILAARLDDHRIAVLHWAADQFDRYDMFTIEPVEVGRNSVPVAPAERLRLLAEEAAQ